MTQACSGFLLLLVVVAAVVKVLVLGLEESFLSANQNENQNI